MLAQVPSVGRNPKGSADSLAYPVPKAFMHVLGIGAPRCLGVARSASSPKAAQALGCSLVWPGHLHGRGCLTARARDTGFPTVVWRMCLGQGCAWARVSAASRHSWLGCWGVCVFVCTLRLYPATPGWGVRCGCVCLDWCFGCAPPLVAGVFGCVCACVRVLCLPCHSWLGCAVWASVFGLGLWLRLASPGWGVGLCVFFLNVLNHINLFWG